MLECGRTQLLGTRANPAQSSVCMHGRAGDRRVPRIISRLRRIEEPAAGEQFTRFAALGPALGRSHNSNRVATVLCVDRRTLPVLADGSSR